MKLNKPKVSARIIAFSALFTILIQSVMDLNDTHMTNPLWAPHARFHWSIQYYASVVLNMVSLYLIWGRYEGARSRLSVSFAALGPLLFWGTFFPSLLMPGTSGWPDGTTPFFFVPPNVIIAVIMTALCVWALYLDGRSRLEDKRLRILESDSGVIPK